MLMMLEQLRFASSSTLESTLERTCWMSSWISYRALPSMLGMTPSSRGRTGSAWLRLSRAASRRRCSKWVGLDSDFSLSSTSQVGCLVCIRYKWMSRNNDRGI